MLYRAFGARHAKPSLLTPVSRRKLNGANALQSHAKVIDREIATCLNSSSLARTMAQSGMSGIAGLYKKSMGNNTWGISKEP